MDDLPKVFGRADLFGRTRDRGFSEVRYMGLNASGMPVFQRRDVDIMTNETTMSRTGGFSNSVLWNFQDAADAPDIVLEHYPGDDGGLVFPATVEILGGVIQLNDLVRNGKVEKIGRGRTMRWKLADRN